MFWHQEFDLKVAGVLSAFVIVIALLPCCSGEVADHDIKIPTGSKWEYSYSRTVDVPNSLHLYLEGEWKYECVGMNNLNISGTGPDVLLFYSQIDAIVTGRVTVYSPFSGTYWVEVTGRFTVSEYEHVNLASRLPVLVETNEELDLGGGSHNSVLYYREHNVTLYSDIWVTPKDYDLRFLDGSISPGAEWTVAYEGSISVEGFMDNEYFTQSYGLSAHVNHTYVADEEVTIPSGNFTCRRLLSEYADGHVTQWYSPVVNGSVKVAVSSEHEWGMSSLVSFELHEETVAEAPPVVDTDPVYLLATAATVAISVGGTVAFHMWRTRRRPVGETSPMPDGERGAR